MVNVMRDNSEISDVLTAVSGLVSVFERQLRTAPSSTAVDVFKLLVSHLGRLYTDQSHCPEVVITVKEKVTHRLRNHAASHVSSWQIFDFLLRIRASGLGQVALMTNNKKDDLDFSPFVLCCNSDASPSPTTGCSYSYINLREMFEVIFLCLKVERSWPVLRLVLGGLNDLLTCKPVILKSDARYVANELANVCAGMVSA